MTNASNPLVSIIVRTKDKRTSIATKDSYIKLCSKTRYGQRMRP